MFEESLRFSCANLRASNLHIFQNIFLFNFIIVITNQTFSFKSASFCNLLSGDSGNFLEIISLNESRNVRIELISKGITFGFLTAKANGTLDTSEIVGIDKDLIIKPFTQKGVVPSLRVFTNNAMNHHHGMQSSETFVDREDIHKAMDLLSDSKY